jgi:hypothetical protein
MKLRRGITARELIGALLQDGTRKRMIESAGWRDADLERLGLSGS